MTTGEEEKEEGRIFGGVNSAHTGLENCKRSQEKEHLNFLVDSKYIQHTEIW